MSNPAGSWNVTVATPFGDQDLTIDMRVDGEKVSGVAKHPAGSFPFDGGRFRDDRVVFEVSLEAPVKADLKIKLRADGDEISGTAKAGIMPSFAVRGTRA
jgi:hypothetical protein